MAPSSQDPFSVEYRTVPGKGLFAAGGLRFKTEECDLRRDYPAVLDQVPFPRLLGEAALWVLWPSTAAIWAFPALLQFLRVDYAILADIGIFLGVQLVTMVFYSSALNHALFVLGNRPLQAGVYLLWGLVFWRAGVPGRVLPLAIWFLLMAFGIAQVIFVTPFLPLLRGVFSLSPADQALRHVARRYARVAKRLLGIAILLSTAGAPLSATLVERLTLEQLADRSERIVHGRCLRTWSAWDANHQAIWTHCEVEVADPLKGGVIKTLVVSEPGGVVDGVEMTIEGVARFERGDEMVLFLYRVPNGLWRARGLGQGKFRVAGGQVHLTLEGLSLLDPARPPTGSTDLRRLDGLSLDRFKAAIRGVQAR